MCTMPCFSTISLGTQHGYAPNPETLLITLENGRKDGRKTASQIDVEKKADVA